MNDLLRLGTIETQHENDVVIVRLAGEHDLATRPAVVEELAAATDTGQGVVVDVTDTEFMDASILNAFIAADHTLAETERRLTLLTNTASQVSRVLALSGLTDLLPCAETREEAVHLAHTYRPK
jgi:anti-sigma B factor antagonist